MADDNSKAQNPDSESETPCPTGNNQQPSQFNQAQLGRNSTLTKGERDAKRELKKRLKQQVKLRKYEMRLRQAVERGDTKVEERARKELLDYRQKIRDGGSTLQNSSSATEPQSATIFDQTERMRNGRAWIVELYEQLIHLCFEQHQQHKQQSNDDSATERIDEEELGALPAKASRKGRNYYRTKNNDREFQTTQARELLINMTRGTQTENMFENKDALLGYTRQKFVERAYLPVLSLERLFIQPITATVPYTSNAEDCGGGSKVVPITKTSALTSRSSSTQRLVDSLSSVQTICSIGCGPGCDAVGVMSFLFMLWGTKQVDTGERNSESRGPKTEASQHNSQCKRADLQSNVQDEQPKIRRLILMDYVMPKWKQLVLDPLAIQLLIPNKYVDDVDMATCDIRRPLFQDESNEAALNVVLKPKEEAGQLPKDPFNALDSSGTIANIEFPSTSSEVDLIVVSYVLTETRGKWHEFFRDLVLGKCERVNENATVDMHCTDSKDLTTSDTAQSRSILRSGTLFLMSEPTAWQLHYWLELVGESLSDYEWLDSSRFAPELQTLEARVGPAVLLARVK